MNDYQSNYLTGYRAGRLDALLGLLPNDCARLGNPNMPGYATGYTAGYRTIGSAA
jgi:hypothetical protein